jgi:hypothetical protein
MVFKSAGIKTECATKSHVLKDVHRFLLLLQYVSPGIYETQAKDSSIFSVFHSSDADPGSGAFLTHGSGILKNLDPASGMNRTSQNIFPRA